MDVTWWGALLAGVISFISPCVLPLVPPYLAYMAGVSMDQLTGEDDTGVAFKRVFLAALAFVAGFTTVFVALGAGATTIGHFLRTNLHIFAYIAGVIIIIMGLHFLGILRIALLYREARVQVRNKPAGVLGAYVIGLAFAFGWSPCIGPILGTVLMLAGNEETVLQGAGLLFVYSLGLGVPFLIAAAFAGPFMVFMGRFRKYMGLVEKVMGGMLVLTGIAFITGYMTEFANWMFYNFEFFQKIG